MAVLAYYKTRFNISFCPKLPLPVGVQILEAALQQRISASHILFATSTVAIELL